MPSIKLLPHLRRYPRLVAALRTARWLPARFLQALLRPLCPPGSRFGPPKGFFSEAELVRNRTVPGEIVLPGQPRPQLKTDSLRALSGLRQHEFQPWPVFWSRRRNARLTSSSLALVDERKRLCLEAAYGELCLPTEPAWQSVCLPAPLRLKGRWTSLVSRWSQGYYHWLADALPRLAVLNEFPPDTRILVPAELLPFQRASLEMLGLMDRVRPTPERHVLVEEYYFSSPTAMTGCANPYAAQFLRSRLLPQAEPDATLPRRFFLQRIGKTRGIRNEEAVLAVFRERGWAILDTEAMPLARQIRLFAQAEAICGLHGAGLANLLWCQPGTKLLELCASTYLNGCYEGLAGDLGLDYHYLLCEADTAYVADVCREKLRRRLDEMELHANPAGSGAVSQDPQPSIRAEV